MQEPTVVLAPLAVDGIHRQRTAARHRRRVEAEGRWAVAGWIRFAAQVLAIAYLTALVSLTTWTAIPMVWGWEPHVVLSGSMEPSLKSGDVLVTAAPRNTQRIGVGAVVVAPDPLGERGLVSHRVVRREDGMLITRGDANQSEDQTPIAPDQVRGVGRLVVPWVGQPTMWLRDGHVAPFAGWVALTLAATVLARRGPSRTDDS